MRRRLQGRSLRQVTREDVDGFLGTLSTSPNISAWQVDQAADSLRILIGSVFGQGWIRNGNPSIKHAYPKYGVPDMNGNDDIDSKDSKQNQNSPPDQAESKTPAGWLYALNSFLERAFSKADVDTGC